MVDSKENFKFDLRLKGLKPWVSLTFIHRHLENNANPRVCTIALEILF